MKHTEQTVILLDEVLIKTGEDTHRGIEYLKSFITSKPKKPITPVLLKEHNKQDVLDYASKLETYEDEMLKWHKEYVNIEENNDFVKSVLVSYIKHQAGLETIPEQYRDKVYNKAYEDGHSDGYYEVYLKICSLIDIFD
jgi:hypothetical protein